MAALAIDQDQRVVGREVAQTGWPDDSGRVADGLGVDVEGGRDIAQEIGQVCAALVDEIFAADYVDRHGRVRHRARLPRPGHDLLFKFYDPFEHFRVGRGHLFCCRLFFLHGTLGHGLRRPTHREQGRKAKGR